MWYITNYYIFTSERHSGKYRYLFACYSFGTSTSVQLFLISYLKLNNQNKIAIVKAFSENSLVVISWEITKKEKKIVFFSLFQILRNIMNLIVILQQQEYLSSINCNKNLCSLVYYRVTKNFPFNMFTLHYRL